VSWALEAKTGGRRSPDWTAGWRCGSLSNVARVRIAELLANAAVDPAAHLDRRRVERYAEALDTLPPVVVFQTEVGLLIADGYHRVAAAQAKGLDTIEADIRTGSLRDALAYAVAIGAGERNLTEEAVLERIRNRSQGRWGSAADPEQLPPSG
jgi:hypothetical protein